MHCSGKDTAKHYPQIARGSELRSHDGSEDGASAGNVQELDKKYFPVGHGNKVNAIGLCHCWGDTVVGTEHPFHKLSVCHIAQKQGDHT